MHTWKEITVNEYYNFDKGPNRDIINVKYFVCINCNIQAKDFHNLGKVFHNDFRLYFKDIEHLTCEEIIIKNIIE